MTSSRKGSVFSLVRSGMRDSRTEANKLDRPIAKWPIVLALFCALHLASAAQASTNLPPACTFVLSPSNATHSAVSSTGFVSVATSPGCGWFVFTSNSWIHVGSSPTNVGAGTVEYLVDANASALARTGLIRIDGRSFFVQQAGAPSTNECVVSISPAGRVHGAGSETAVIDVSVPPGCSWSYINTNAWITTLPFVGAGDGGLQYTVAANPSTFTRTGVISISGQPYLVTQFGATNEPPVCSFDLSPLGRDHGSGVSTGMVEVATASNCFWLARTTNFWITLLSPATNFGSGTVLYRLASNSGPGRTGYISIDGQVFTVGQAGTSNVPPACTFALSPSNATHSANSSTGFVEVATSSNCFWTAFTTNSWIRVVSGSTNVGSGLVIYLVDANNSAFSRTGLIRIDGRNFFVLQAGNSNLPPACTFALSPSNATHNANSSTGFVEVATSSNCFWTAFTTNSWIRVVSGSTNLGSGLVAYLVDANESSLARTGQIRIDGRIFFVQQAGTSPTNQPPSVRMILPIDGSRFAAPVTLGFAADAQDFDGSIVSVEFFANDQSIGQGVRSNTGASWQTNQWYFSWSNVPPAEYNFRAKATDNRGATTFSAPVHVTVYSTNVPPECGFALSPPGRNHGSGVSTGTVQVTTSENCFWLARTTNFWITLLSPTTNFGSGTVLYRLLPNSGPGRTGYIQIDGQLFTVGQAGGSNAPPACIFVLSPSNAVHAASSSTGFVEVATSSNCFWTAFTTNSWIHVVSGATNVGSGLVVYLVDANDSVFSRSGLIRIDGRLFSVLQAGSSNVPPQCTFVLSPPARNHGSGVSTGTVEVTTAENCFWLARTTNFWITLFSPVTNFGSGTVLYRLAANSGPGRTGYLQIDGQVFRVGQAGSTNGSGTNVPPVTPGLVNLGTVLVSNLGHRFLSFPLPGFPSRSSSVVDLFVDQDHESNGGASLPSVSINWDTNSQFVLRVAAPLGRKFLVQVPEGAWARFDGFLWWESTRGGFSPYGTAVVTLEGLEGASPDFSDSSPTLSDSHGYFGFMDVTSSSFAGQLTFTAIRLVGTVTPQFTGNGTEHYVPHLNSTLSVVYATSQTNDPGRFVSIVPIVPPPGIQVLPPLPGGCATVSLSGPEGRMVVVECSEDLLHWIPISTNVAPCTVIDHTGTNAPRRFYRTLELP